MIEGSTIRLRAWCDKDIPALIALRNDVELQAKLLARARGSDEGQVRKWVHDRSTMTNSIFFIIASRDDDRVIGYLQFLGLDFEDRGADLGICLVPGLEGRGIGQEVLNLVLPYLRDERAIHKVSLRVRSDNLIAIRCYQKVGFERCGLLRKHIFLNKHFHDVVLMECFLDSSE